MSEAFSCALQAYLGGFSLSPEQIDEIREYLRPTVRDIADENGGAMLREALDRMQTRRDVSRWLVCAWEMGLDPLL